MGTCASAPTAPAPLESLTSVAQPPPLRIPTALRNPARLAEKSFGSTIGLVRSSFKKLQDKIQLRMEAAPSLTASAESSKLLIRPDQGDTIIGFRASELVPMVDTILYLLDSQQLKKAANKDSAASANLDTLRMLGETAGRVRRNSSVGRSGLTVTDKDIANYVLDEFASVQQLSAADVQALNEAAAKRAASKKHRRSSGIEEGRLATSPGLLPSNENDTTSTRSAAGTSAGESKSGDAARAASPPGTTDRDGSSPQRPGSGEIDRTEGGESLPVIATDPPATADTTTGVTGAASASAPVEGGPHSAVAVLSGGSPGSPGRAFRKGRRALARLVTVTGRIASDAVERHVAHSADLLEQIAPTLSPDQIDAVLGVTGDNSGWDLDALAVEQAISFPSGIKAARIAALSAATLGGCDPASGDGEDLALLAAASRASQDQHSSRRVAAMAFESAIGSAGSGGHDGLSGVPRLALPFVGAMLLRRHGFILGASDASSPRTSVPAASGMGAVSLTSTATPVSAAGAASASATAAVAKAAVGAVAAGPAMALELQEETVVRFLRRLSDGYRSNPYHNATHALDVMHSAHSIALSPHLLGVIKREHKLAMLLGAALHDYRHDGLNNALHTKLRSPLALRYNDQSVLENMHVAEAYALMATPDEDLDVLGDLDYEAGVAVRGAMVQMVLATDMRFHFQALEDFEVNVLPIVRSYHAEAISVMSEARAQRKRAAARQTASQRKAAGGVRLSDSDRYVRDTGAVSITPSATAGDPDRASTGTAGEGLWMAYPSEMSDGGASTTSPRGGGGGGGGGVGGADLTSPSSHSGLGTGTEDASAGASLTSGAARYQFGGAVGAVPGRRQARLSVVSAPVAELQAHSMVIAKLAMHAADVSNPVKELATYRKWAARCMAEFYHIGDAEKAAGLTPSTFFDREARNMPKCQIGFISFIVRPLFAALSELVTDHAANWKLALDTNQAYFESALSEGAVDDAQVDGDWFEDDAGSKREGAMPESPFLPLS